MSEADRAEVRAKVCTSGARIYEEKIYKQLTPCARQPTHDRACNNTSCAPVPCSKRGPTERAYL